MTLLLALLVAQTFEAASVKLAGPDSDIGPIAGSAAEEMVRFQGGPGTRNPERIRYKGVTLKMLVQRAYDVPAAQVSGPGWITSERYTIEATLAPGSTKEQARLMLRDLLEKRFELRTHREEKAVASYVVTVAKNGGAKLQPPRTIQQTASERAEAALARMKQSPGRSRSLGLDNGTVAEFLARLAAGLDRPVIDHAGIEGRYSFDLIWDPGNEPSEFSSHPPLSRALEEQLGLRLTPRNETLSIVVIDNTLKIPTAN